MLQLCSPHQSGQPCLRNQAAPGCPRRQQPSHLLARMLGIAQEEWGGMVGLRFVWNQSRFSARLLVRPHEEPRGNPGPNCLWWGWLPRLCYQTSRKAGRHRQLLRRPAPGEGAGRPGSGPQLQLRNALQPLLFAGLPPTPSSLHSRLLPLSTPLPS